MDGADDRGGEEQELRVVGRVVAGVEEVAPVVGRHRPVVVLARAVDALERLLVEQAREAAPRRDAPHDVHQQHVVVGGAVDVLEDRRHLVLVRRHLVVARLGGDAERPRGELDLLHEGDHAVGDRAEVVVLHLLALRGGRAEDRARRHLEVGARVEPLAVDEEVLLLGAHRRVDAAGRLPDEAAGSRVADFEISSIERSSGVFWSSVSPFHERKTVGMQSVAPRSWRRRNAGEVGSHAV